MRYSEREQKPDEQSNERLMLRFQRTGDAEAFAGVVARCLPSAIAIARRILNDTALAEDAVQEAFLRVVRRREAYIPSQPFSSWFYTILRNVCVDTLRRRARQTRLVREASARHPAMERPTDSATDALDLLAALPKGERDVLVLRIAQELSFREVGSALGISEEAAKKRAQRGLKRLRTRYHARQGRPGRRDQEAAGLPVVGALE